MQCGGRCRGRANSGNESYPRRRDSGRCVATNHSAHAGTRIGRRPVGWNLSRASWCCGQSQARDGDGYWLAQLRSHVGKELPIIGTLDAHANLSQQMVDACQALVAYRTNPHLDQRERGMEAARLMVRTVRGEIRPTMAASFPPLVVNIERQCTSEPHWQPLYQLADQQLSRPAFYRIAFC